MEMSQDICDTGINLSAMSNKRCSEDFEDARGGVHESADSSKEEQRPFDDREPRDAEYDEDKSETDNCETTAARSRQWKSFIESSSGTVSVRDGVHHFKIMVPSPAAGAIIGKGGETIAKLKKDAGALVQMSKANDFYPGTTERVCLITGTVDAIMAVLIFIMEKIVEKPDLNAVDFHGKTGAERDKQEYSQMKILVPNATAGKIIGKAGSYINQIKEESGSYVQISQKAKEQILQERCITVIGSIECNTTACLMILSKVAEDPQSGLFQNVSYADISGPVANYKPTGSPFAQHGHQQSAQQFGHHGVQQAPMHTSNAMMSTNSLNASTAGGWGLLVNGGINLGLNLRSPSQGITSQVWEHIRMTLQRNGFSDQAIDDITSALNTLVQYGILDMSLGIGAGRGNPSSSGRADSTLSSQRAGGGGGGGNNRGVFGPIGTMSGHDNSSSIPRRGRMNRYGKDGSSSSRYDPFR